MRLSIISRLAKSDADNAGWQSDLADTYDWIGDVQRAQSDLGAAMSSYQASLAIRERLTKSYPNNATWKRGLMVSHNKIGNIQPRQGDLATALRSYQAMLTIIEPLAKSDPSNAGWQRDLSVCNDKVGEALFGLGQAKQALSYFDAAIQFRKAPDDAAFFHRWRALTNFYTNDIAGAADDAATAVKLDPTNANYTIWLHIVRARIGQNDAGSRYITSELCFSLCLEFTTEAFA